MFVIILNFFIVIQYKITNKYFIMNITLKKSDLIGASSSALCLVHCLATPFFFIAATCSKTCCSAAPGWWQSIDYIFVIVSFLAVIYSIKSSDNKIVKYGLVISWLFLCFMTFNLTFQWVFLHENIRFIPAFSLIGFHVYNLFFCKNDCC